MDNPTKPEPTADLQAEDLAAHLRAHLLDLLADTPHFNTCATVLLADDPDQDPHCSCLVGRLQIALAYPDNSPVLLTCRRCNGYGLIADDSTGRHIVCPDCKLPTGSHDGDRS